MISALQAQNAQMTVTLRAHDLLIQLDPGETCPDCGGACGWWARTSARCST
jgi:hypothetical protein